MGLKKKLGSFLPVEASLCEASSSPRFTDSTAPSSQCSALSPPWADTWCPGGLGTVLSQGCWGHGEGRETGSSAEAWTPAQLSLFLLGTSSPPVHPLPKGGQPPHHSQSSQTFLANGIFLNETRGCV